MILSDVIAEARTLLQDTHPTLQRYTDAELLKFANQALKRMAILRPDLFSYFGAIDCLAGTVIQSLPSDAIRLMEVFSVVGGGAVRETNRETMDDTYPTWVSETAGPAVNWMRHPRSQTKFFLYPQAPANQQLIVEYAQAPSTYEADEPVDLLPDAYYPVVLDGVIFLAESIDNEHVNSGRAELFQKSFSEALAVGLQARALTDKENAGIDQKEEKTR